MNYFVCRHQQRQRNQEGMTDDLKQEASAARGDPTQHVPSFNNIPLDQVVLCFS